MNNKLANFRESSRHQSQNDLPPIDKFHPDWWYYRQEVEEPVEIDNNYKNESRHMNKKLIRLTESDLHRIVKESVNRILKEAKYDYENQAYDEKYDGENTYLQVSMMSSPEIYIKCNNGRKPSSDYIKTYNILSSNQPEKVLDLWRKFAYESNVVTNISDERKFIVEKDADGIYLMIRVDNKKDFQRYQNGNW